MTDVYISITAKKDRLLSSGTTATICLIKDGTQLTVANVGDSRAVLCQNRDCVRLTEDHLPFVPAESERIVRCNGFVAQSSHGTPRVNGVLEMTRSIGDVELKPFGVIAEPEVTTVQVCEDILLYIFSFNRTFALH